MEKNRNTILVFYGVLSLVVILCSIPDLKGQNMGMSLVTIELIVAYIARWRWPAGDSFEGNHATFLIRSMWMYSFLYTIGAFITIIAVYQNGDLTALDDLSDALASGNALPQDSVDTQIKKYISDNAEMTANTFRLWICPAQFYLVWRILRGGGRAFKAYRIANPKSWI